MGDTLAVDQRLELGERLVSAAFTLWFQDDANLVLYDGDIAVVNAYWSSETEWLPPAEKPTYGTVRSDGSFVLCKDDGSSVWSSGTWGPDFADPQLILQADGNLVV